ncbi:hypothetical protein ACFL4N_07725 [Thermodesulfobacteriota bacterium]
MMRKGNDGFRRSGAKICVPVCVLMVLCLILLPAQGLPADNTENNIRILRNEKNDWFKRVKAAIVY